MDLRRYAESVLDEAFGRFPIARRPALEWRDLRVTAGVAYFRRNAIGLSRRLMVDAERVRTTVLHEYAHLLAVARSGPSAANHGPAWQRAMRDLGLRPEVRHRYDVQRNVPRQRVIYRCLRCGVEVARTRRLPKNRRYIHRTCGGDLGLLRIERVTPDSTGA